jgi:integrase
MNVRPHLLQSIAVVRADIRAFMARLINRLSARTVETIRGTGLHADGGGLYLSTTNGGRRWVFIFRWDGKRREMGLGSARDVSLAKAREAAAAARAALAEGRNPIDERETNRAAAREANTRSPQVLTFGAFADEYISSVEEGWRNEVHRRQWRTTLRDHAHMLTDKPLADICTDDILEVLQPIWLTKSETASRVRGRIEKILSAAKARGLRPRDAMNPAQWRGHLDVLLPKRQRLTRGHHAAMPYADLPSFYAGLSRRPATAARALQFLILCASRTGEVRGARRLEIEADNWTIPAARMKAGVSHTVTLSAAAQGILEAMGSGAPDDYIFHNGDPKKPLSNMSMEMLLRRMGADAFTVHGFRSTFKDWSMDCTEFPDELSEEALAHIVGSKVRRAYRRGEALARRRKLMEAWAEYAHSMSEAAAFEQQEAA